MLEIMAPVGKLRPGTTGNHPDDVRRVQYLFNQTPEAAGAPSFLFDTTNGICRQDLIDAITAFQTFQFGAAEADGRVDVGHRTIATLNQVADLSAFAAVREPDEFLSWLRRPADWNFTLQDLLRLGPSPFSFSVETTTWLPDVYQTNLVDMFLAVLDPADTVPGSWGIGAWDLYHGHVVVLRDQMTSLPEPADPAVLPLVPSFRAADAAIDALRTSAQPRTLTSVPDLTMYAEQLFSILGSLTQPLEDLASTGEVSVYYHSFESSNLLGGTSRYAGYREADPRRNWLAPLGGIPTRYASADHPDRPFDDFYNVLQLAFLVEKDGVVATVAGTKDELVAITLEPFATIF
jgi:hypothetical protein